MKTKIFYVTNTDWSLFNWRLPVIRALQTRGYHTGAVSMKGDYWERMSDVDDLIALRNYRRRINIFADLLLIHELFSIFRKYRPDLVHFFTSKSVIYGSIAAKLAGVPFIVNTITGLGTAFCRYDKPTVLLKDFVLIPLYKLVCKLSDLVFFQNSADRSLFVGRNIVSEAKSVIIPGSGVDTSQFCSNNVCRENLSKLRGELGIPSGSCVIMMAARMIYEKGVEEYVAAAQVVKRQYPHAVFLLVGPADSRSVTAIPYAQLKKWNDQGTIIYCGMRDDVQDLLELSDIVVLPSYYAEGIPKVLLEAGAMAKPAITTTTPGCSDVVKDCRTGLLVQPKNIPQLVDAMVRLIEDESLRRELGLAAREAICGNFDLERVVEITVGKYQELPGFNKG